MISLEDKIRKNREMADYRDPFPGHDRRFIKKAELINSRRKNISWLLVSMTAASILFAVMILSGIFPFKQNTTISDMPKEINQAIYYYDNMSAILFTNISILKAEDQNELNRIRNDIELYDKWNLLIMNDYMRFPDDERVRNALIELHRNKAEMLNELYEQLLSKDFQII